MNISVVSTMAGHAWGGSEELWYQFVQYCQQHGHHCKVAKKHWKNEPQKLQLLQVSGVVFYYRKNTLLFVYKLIDFLGNRLFYNPMEGKLKLAGYLKFINPYTRLFTPDTDFMLISQGATYELLDDVFLTYLIRKTKIPLFLICHGNSDFAKPYGFNFQEQRKNFKLVSGCFFVSKRNLQTTERQLAMRLPNTAIAKNPVNLSDIQYQAYPALKTPFLLVVLATYDTITKGQDVLLEVLSQPKWKSRPYELHLYGSGNDQMYLQELIHHFELQDKVFLKGYRHTLDILKPAHLVILPSVSEGMPLVLVEAMLVGRPTVITHIAGMPELVQDGEHGFIAAAPKDVFLDEALERAWQQQPSWEEMGKCARMQALTYYEPQPAEALLNQITEFLS
ncbi:MAG: glycosyltransferase family 4 protein [Saprospiraceae bacterium]|nr:glycosyltransferase family 4 protein [Saprospiraceae bacterium]